LDSYPPLPISSHEQSTRGGIDGSELWAAMAVARRARRSGWNNEDRGRRRTDGARQPGAKASGSGWPAARRCEGTEKQRGEAVVRRALARERGRSRLGSGVHARAWQWHRGRSGARAPVGVATATRGARMLEALRLRGGAGKQSHARAWQAELRAALMDGPRSFARGEMPRRRGHRGATEAALRLARMVADR